MIRVLPDVVQNKIAAGEVVERPASVVKELVENAVDAGASRINIEVEEGGMRSIRISDDGSGMSRDDLLLSIERHATSKIRDVEDIFSITTMGFRGEALPSIASVSRLTISTCTEGEEAGNSLKVTGGKREGIMPAPPRKGTVVEVNDLFFNTPARRKFMKSQAGEMGAINETITRIALANYRTGFYVKGNGKKSMELPARHSLAERITDLFGRNIELLPVEYTTSSGELRITGYCGKPPESRGNSKFIYTLLNNRWIRHSGVNRGIIDAYQGSIAPRRYPFAVICFEIDPAKVDVNAHPTKEVVRFENDSLFVGGCRKALEKVLRYDNANSDFDFERRESENARRSDAIRTEVESYIAGTSQGSGGSFKESGPRYIRNVDFREASVKTGFGGDSGTVKNGALLSSNKTESARSCLAESKMIFDGLSADKDVFTEKQTSLDIDKPGKYRYVGQVGGKYIIAEYEDGVVFIDQHALHERWNYNRLSGRERSLDAQRLLIPVEIELSAVEQGLIAESMVVLEEAGFEMKLEGSKLVITAHPDIVRPHNIEQVVRDMLSDIDASPVKEYRDRINASLACRSAVLFGTNLSDELCMDLLEKLGSGALFTCPHGRPTKIAFTWKDLAYKFDR